MVTILIMVALISLQIFLGTRTHDYRLVATPADAGMATAVQQQAPGVDGKVHVTVRPVADDAAARRAVLDGDAEAWLHRGDGGWVLTSRSQAQDPLQAVATQVVRTQTLRANASAAGTTVEALQRGSTLTATFLQGDADRATLVTIVTFAFSFLFYLSTLMFGMTLSNSVVEEKQSRVVEIIATAIPVRHLLAGKVAGNSLLAIAQLVLYVAVGLTGLAFTSYSALVPAVSGPVLWFLVFFLAGFVTLACLWAVAGSLASRTEDVQSTTTPLTMLTMGVFFAGLSLDGTWQTVGSFVPPLSAVLMPIRLLQGGAPWWQAVIALALLLITSAGTVAVGERLYRRSLLQTGGRIGWRQAWRAQV